MPANSLPQITQKYLKSRLDYRDGRFYWKPMSELMRDAKRWNSRYSGKRAGYLHSGGYRHIKLTINGKKQSYKEHRLAWLWVLGHWPANEIDHGNGVKDDNRIENLRDVDRIENMKNARIYSSNTSGVTGVLRHKDSKKWHSQIRVDKKNIYLGSFHDKFNAICARKSAEVRYNFHPNHGRAA